MNQSQTIKPAEQPTEKPMDAKTAHILETAKLALEAFNIRTRLDAINARTGELSYILMTMDQMELQNEQVDNGGENDN